MCDAEVHATAAREYLVADGTGHGIRIAFCRRMRFGEGDAHLHGAAGTNRITLGEKSLAERYHVDEVLENFAQLQFGLHVVEPLVIAFAVWRRQRKCSHHHKLRHSGALALLVDFLPCDTRKSGNRRVNAESGFLFGDGNNGTYIFRRWRDFHRGDCCVNVGSPSCPVGHIRRDEPANERASFGGSQRTCRGCSRRFIRGTTRQHERDDHQTEPTKR